MDEKDQETVRPQRDYEPMEGASTLDVCQFFILQRRDCICRTHFCNHPQREQGPSGIALSEYIYVTSSLLGYLSPSYPIEQRAVQEMEKRPE